MALAIGVGATPVGAADLDAIGDALWARVRESVADVILPDPPLVFRDARSRGAVVYRKRVTAVVVVAAGTAIGAGVVVGASGEIVTNDHVLRETHHAADAEWTLVWFKPTGPVRPERKQFLVARVALRDPARDLALVVLAQPLPGRASIAPIDAARAEIGQEVFAIAHSRTHFWTLGQGIIAHVRTGDAWTGAEGAPRQATTIQVQLPVEPGASGAPLFAVSGALAGVIVGQPSGAATLAVAVHAAHVRDLLDRYARRARR